MKAITSTFILTLVISIGLNSCANNKQEFILANSSPCDTINTKYSTVIAPIIQTSCNTTNGCHGGSSAGSIPLESYQQVKDNYSSILTRINSGNMPKNNSKLDDCKILKIQTWVNRGAQNN